MKSVKRTYTAVPGMVPTASYVTALDDVEVLDIPTVGWALVEAKFQELRALLSAPTTGLNASQARDEQKRVVSAAISRLLDRCQAECRRLLISGNAKAAVEGGLKTLKLKEEFYGPGSLQLVPAYFHLARTNQFMDKFKRAEEFLSLAQYEVLRHPEADISLSAELHQTFGLLYASDGKLDAALKQLTSATYYLSCMHGPEHVLTSFGYFDLGNVFAAKSHMENAMAFYEKVKKIWEGYLSEQLTHLLSSSPSYQSPESLGEENLQDAVKMLRGIVSLQAERYGVVHPSPAMAEQALGMFLLWSGDATGAFESLLRALEIYRRVLGERHPKCQNVRVLLVNHGFQVPEDTSDVIHGDEIGAAAASPPPSADAVPSASVPSTKASAPVAAAPQASSSRPESRTDEGVSEAPATTKVPTPPRSPPPAKADAHHRAAHSSSSGDAEAASAAADHAPAEEPAATGAPEASPEQPAQEQHEEAADVTAAPVVDEAAAPEPATQQEVLAEAAASSSEPTAPAEAAASSDEPTAPAEATATTEAAAEAPPVA